MVEFHPCFFVSECNTWRYCSNSGLPHCSLQQQVRLIFFGIRSIHDLPCFEATKPLMSQAFFWHLPLVLQVLKTTLTFWWSSFSLRTKSLKNSFFRPVVALKKWSFVCVKFQAFHHPATWTLKKARRGFPVSEGMNFGRLRGWWTVQPIDGSVRISSRIKSGGNHWISSRIKKVEVENFQGVLSRNSTNA